MRIKSLLFFTVCLLLIGATPTQAKSNISGTATADFMGDEIQFDIEKLPFPSLNQKDKDDLVAANHAAIFDFLDANGNREMHSDEVTPGCTDDLNDLNCLLTGFGWSDNTGWLVLDGLNELIKPHLTTQNPPGDYYARVHFNYTTKKFPLTGYIWDEKIGWIRLSSDLDNGNTLDADGQYQCDTNGDCTGWGVWIDVSTLYPIPPGKLIGEPDRDEAANLKLKGYAWSENMGWIRFDDEDPNEGTITAWKPDVTAPQLLANDKAWFPAINADGHIDWDNFAKDTDSGIIDSTLAVTIYSDINDPDPNKFTGCSSGTITPSLVPNNATPLTATTSLKIETVGIMPLTAEGYCKFTLTGTIRNAMGLIQYIGGNPPPETPEAYKKLAQTFFVRAGDPETSLTTDSDLTALADGTDEIKYVISLKDKVGLGNPIVPVNCSSEYPSSETCPGTRSVSGNINITNNLKFDVEQRKDLPVNIENLAETQTPLFYENASAYFSFELVEKSLNVNLPSLPYTGSNTYNLGLISYAPTSSLNSVKLDTAGFQFRIQDQALPEVSIGLTGSAAKSTDKAVIVADPTFTPPLLLAYATPPYINVVTSPNVENGLQFSIENTSKQNPIAVSVDSGFSLAEPTLAFEITNIYEKDDMDSNKVIIGPIGRTDTKKRQTFFLLAGESPSFSEDTTDPSITAFYDRDQNKFPPYDFLVPDTENTDFYFSYKNGATEPTVKRDTDGKFIRADVEIARARNSKKLKDFITDPITDPKDPTDFTLYFTPKHTEQAEGESNIIIIQQHISYRYKSIHTLIEQPVSTIFPISTSTSSGLASIGVEYTGTATGKNIFDLVGGRDIQNVSSSGLRALRETMRRNVADLTARKDGCDVGAAGGANGSATLTALPTGPACVTTNGDEIIAYYSDNTPTDGTIDTFILDGTSDISVPTGKRYTIIVKGGNLWVKDNVMYENPANSSFGIILLTDEKGQGGNLFMAPEPTNMVGNLYAEGAILSRNNLGSYYYGEQTADVNENDLNNQLFWQGNIASLNTLGGAAKGALPEGAICIGTDTSDPELLLACSRRYDLDYIRRYTPTGGGLPSIGIGVPPKSTAPFYIERDPHLDSNPPPGFSVSAGFESEEVIR